MAKKLGILFTIITLVILLLLPQTFLHVSPKSPSLKTLYIYPSCKIYLCSNGGSQATDGIADGAPVESHSTRDP